MEHTQLGRPPKERFLKTIRGELDAFEKREREFVARERKERAATLKLDLMDLSNKSRKLLPAVTP